MMNRMMHNVLLAAGIAVVTLAGAFASPATAQERQRDTSFRWSGSASPGAWLNARNTNGSVRVETAAGSDVQVRATKSWRRGDPADVRVHVTRYGPDDRDILVCVLWGEQSRCTENGYRGGNDDRRGRRSNDVSVELVISVPRGVNIRSSTVNGSVNIVGATAEVRANSVNGNVRAESSGGPVEARAVNGNVFARMGRIDSAHDLSYGSVNGNVVVEFSGDLNAEIEMSTVNGGFETNFPLPLRGRINPRSIRATVGTGGRNITLSTVNGNVELRKN